MSAKPLPPLELLCSRYSYDPETGVLTSRYNGLPIRKVGGTGYLCVRIGKTNYRLGRIIWKMMTGKDPSLTIDHINRSKNDNRWVNLRDVTIKVNANNRDNCDRQVHRCSVSVKRVLNHGKFECWHVHIPIDGKYVYIGQSRDKATAYAMFSEAAWKRHRGEAVR